MSHLVLHMAGPGNRGSVESCDSTGENGGAHRAHATPPDQFGERVTFKSVMREIHAKMAEDYRQSEKFWRHLAAEQLVCGNKLRATFCSTFAEERALWAADAEKIASEGI